MGFLRAVFSSNTTVSEDWRPVDCNRRSPMSTSYLPVPTPCIVLDPDGITEEGRTILLDSKGECHTRNIEALGSNLRFSLTWQQGWILASDPSNLSTFLSNPVTLDKIELPHFSHQLPREFKCALSHKPTNDKCVVVVLHQHPDETTLWYCRIGGDKWTKYDYNLGTQQMDAKGKVWKKIVIYDLAPCKGKFFTFITPEKLGVLEFDPLPTTRVMVTHGIPRNVPPNPRGSMAHCCSFEMDDDLYFFFAYYYGDSSITTSIALYKVVDIGRRKQQWREIDEIGDDRALLWSGLHAGSCSATKFGLEPNCVYWINRSDRLMHISNILEKTERVCEPSKDLPKNLPKLSPDAIWLLPME